MRIIFVGRSKKRTQSSRHLVEAFRRAGCAVAWLRRTWVEDVIGYRWLIHKARRFRPEVLFLYTHKPPMEVVAALHEDQVPMVFFLPSVHLEPEKQILDLARKSVKFFITNTGQLDFYRRQGVPSPQFLSQGFDPRTHFPDPSPSPRWRSQVAFIGKHRPGDTRAELLSSLVDRWDVKIYGSGWEEAELHAYRKMVYPRQYRAICAATEIVLGHDTQAEVPLCFSNRTWLTLGCAGFLLTSYVPQLGKLFTNHRHLVWYRSTEECQNLIEYYLSHPQERHEIAEAGHNYVKENFTYDHVAERILQAISEKTGFPIPQQRPEDAVRHFI